jgi:hypothetical protein
MEPKFQREHFMQEQESQIRAALELPVSPVEPGRQQLP